MAVGIILPAESNSVLIEGQEAVIGDGDAMSVTGEIGQDMVRPAERWFGIHHPVVAKQSSQEGEKAFLVFDWLAQTASSREA